jgi:hypothetical protein
MNRHISKILILLPFLLIFTYCSDNIVESVPSIDENDEQTSILPKFSEIQEKIFTPSCATSGCHSSGGVNPVLAGNSYQNIVNKQSSAGIDYIEPNDPDNSYLIRKILGSDGISGSRMPLNRSPLSETETDAIINWVEDGAENN